MKTLLFILLSPVILFPLGDDYLSNVVEKPEKYEQFADNAKNGQTGNDTIETATSPGNSLLLSMLKRQLAKDKFSLSAVKEMKTTNFFNYMHYENINYKDRAKLFIKGKGIHHYFAKSSKPVDNLTTKYYPDFYMTIYTFSDEVVARKNFDILTKMLELVRKTTPIKAPEDLAYNGKEVYHFATRAGVFSPYIVKYAFYVKDFR